METWTTGVTRADCGGSHHFCHAGGSGGRSASPHTLRMGCPAPTFRPAAPLPERGGPIRQGDPTAEADRTGRD